MSTKAGVSGDQHGEALPISSSNKPVLRASPPILQRHTGPNDLFVAPYDQARALSFDSEHKLRSENIPFDIDVWYPQLQHFTFPTQFIPLSRGEARAIVLAYRATFIDQQPAGQVLDQEHRHTLRFLEARIDRVISTHFKKTGCFMRLCGRSAKDAEPRDRDRIRQEYKSQLERLRKETAGVDDGTPLARLPGELKMRAIGQVNLLKATSGADVMAMLLSSERVYSDMLDWLWFGEPEQIVLREWEPELSVDYEFRLYVNDSKLCAISQYDHYCRYDHLFPRKEEFERKMRGLWQEIHPRVGTASYCIDFAFLPSQDSFVLVELSPFLRCTGAHCFRWANSHDNDVLCGKAPFEFRLVEKSFPHFDSMVKNGWDKRWIPENDPPMFWSRYETKASRRLYEVFHRHRFLLQLAAAAAFHNASGQFKPLKTRPSSGVVDQTSNSSDAATGQASEVNQHYLFVYGTLKRGMHWHSKFLSHKGVHFCGEATTEAPVRLTVGKCGVPYLLLTTPSAASTQGAGGASATSPGVEAQPQTEVDAPKCVHGELWIVDDDTLTGLDQYEGVGKGYYQRRPFVVNCMTKAGISQVQAFVYGIDGFCASEQLTSMTSSTETESTTPAGHDESCGDGFPESRSQYLQNYTTDLHRKLYRPVEHILLKQEMYLAGHPKYNHREAHPQKGLRADVSAASAE